MSDPRQKITFDEMRASGIRGLLIYCADYQCSHWTAISGDPWSDEVRLSDIEPRFTCQACGTKGADVWPTDLAIRGTALRWQAMADEPDNPPFPVGRASNIAIQAAAQQAQNEVP